MSIAAELSAVYDGFQKNGPAEITDTIRTATSNFKTSYDPSTAIQPGSTLPSFTLTDALGKSVSSSDLLAKGPLLLTFYGGEWCPFCNIALRGLQQKLPEFTAKGLTLVAISPELPDTALTTVEKMS